MSTNIRGAILQARKTFVVEHFGKEAWQRVMEALPEEDQKFFNGIVVSAGWYPFEIGKRLDQAIVDVLGHGDPKVFEEIGAKSARKNLSGIHKPFLRPGNPQGFLSQANTIYKFYYDTGYRKYEATGLTSGVMTTYEAETFSVPDCLTVIGWYKEALKMCGAKNVEIIEESCRAKGDPYCRYRISWEME